MKRIEDAQIAIYLQEIPSWGYQKDRQAIQKELRFLTFGDCFAFMTRVAFLADSMNHHPEFLQCYNRLSILLTTHDVDGLSELDIKMAKAIDKMEVT